MYRLGAQRSWRYISTLESSASSKVLVSKFSPVVVIKCILHSMHGRQGMFCSFVLDRICVVEVEEGGRKNAGDISTRHLVCRSKSCRSLWLSGGSAREKVVGPE
jgi:hypothetical protein